MLYVGNSHWFIASMMMLNSNCNYSSQMSANMRGQIIGESNKGCFRYLKFEKKIN